MVMLQVNSDTCGVVDLDCSRTDKQADKRVDTHNRLIGRQNDGQLVKHAGRRPASKTDGQPARKADNCHHPSNPFYPIILLSHRFSTHGYNSSEVLQPSHNP